MALIQQLGVQVAPAPTPPARAQLGLLRPRSSRKDGRRAAARLVRAGGEVAADVVRGFYDGVNRRDLAAVEPLIAESCVYEDLVFAQPFVGREEILDFFGGFMGSISSDLRFVIDDISGEDSCAVGVTWHLEWKGRPFPFSRGCSFYRLQQQQQGQQLQIVYGRDCVEPAAKPGELALLIIRAVTWILERFPSLASML
ncbi:hypothetical protein ABZP36_024498 [Zizania latifolia]